jgi:hypothetical protein
MDVDVEVGNVLFPLALGNGEEERLTTFCPSAIKIWNKFRRIKTVHNFIIHPILHLVCF